MTRCEHCKYWDRDGDVAGAPTGHCCRHVPQPIAVVNPQHGNDLRAAWPKTVGVESCGEGRETTKD